MRAPGAAQTTLGLGGADSPVGRPAENGEVFTRRWVVDLILDLCGYTADRDLARLQVVEPACGAGAFLGPIIDRLIASCEGFGRDLLEARHAIRAFDLLPEAVAASRRLIEDRLVGSGADPADARRLAESWTRQADFLLADLGDLEADHVGNPPYIRLENLPPGRNAAYREACPAMRGRSDIFVGFIERSLRLLRPGGALGFIVADRWMRNQYGAALRKLVEDEFAVEAVIEMHDVEAFEAAVAAYPAITLIRKAEQKRALVASTTSEFGENGADALREWAGRASSGRLEAPSVRAAWLTGWPRGGGSWPWGDPEHLALIAELESRLPPLQGPDTGTHVGIGLATGADDIYLTADPDLVEPERLLPMAMARDLAGGEIRWSGTYLVNPWSDDGLVDLGDWPRLGAYLESHGDRVRMRHTARKNPSQWYRTIDRVTPGHARAPQAAAPRDEGGRPPRHRRGPALPPPQSLSHHVDRMGSRGPRRPFALRPDEPVRRRLLREDARRQLPVPSTVSTTGPSASSRRRRRRRPTLPCACVSRSRCWGRRRRRRRGAEIVRHQSPSGAPPGPARHLVERPQRLSGGRLYLGHPGGCYPTQLGPRE